MFLTANYEAKKEKYKALKIELTEYRSQHNRIITQLTDLMNSATGRFTSVSATSDMPNGDTLNKTEEIVEEIERLLKQVKNRNDSLDEGVSIAMKKYTHYLDLYVAEKKREADYHAEQARIVLDRLNKQQEAMRNNKIIPK
ncbi:hypothetical protein I6N95_08170 [Vagococcus sp. BWB3-3]|uniref:Uncharacterized protein n=1 Tax=Vagococcus allomyrinae TaxID=2794353 RepID=A0A940SVD8_9ENTE|nr:hypothetical protein [Vagococcus allomyrinae]MBP1040976.1 hypothetical protein [Vagococcus allomyrinae]